MTHQDILKCIPTTLVSVFNTLTTHDSTDAIEIWDYLAQFITNGSTIFFPQYTDHGPDHITTLLTSYDDLIPDSCKNKLTANDVFVLVTSTLIHDIAMRMDVPHLNSLLNGTDDFCIKLNTKWKDFCAEVQHWDHESVRSRLGDNSTIPKGTSLMQFRNSDMAVVGEFLRRYHADVANYIAESSLQPLLAHATSSKLKRSYTKDITLMLKLAGQIAKSHNYGLRDSSVAIEIAFSHRPYESRGIILNVHFIYIMSLLRLSDCLDFRNSASQYFLTNTLRLSSPISYLEHATMAAFSNIVYLPDMQAARLSYDTDHPHINANFLKYSKGIQEELDFCWAMLSEAYSVDNKTITIGNSGLCVRRIIPHNYSGVAIDSLYYEEPLHITIRDSSVINLLAYPLYSANPLFSIREALSNAHDACCDYADSTSSDYSGTIEINLDFENGIITFKDNGVGMSFNDMKLFFLHVGGRLRGTIEWKAQHVSKGELESTSYPFSSRFGVGVVSLFMIGANLLVKTKKQYGSGTEIELDTSSKQILAKKFNSDFRGTEIKIFAEDPILKKLTDKFKRSEQGNDLEMLAFAMWSLMYVPFEHDIFVTCNDGSIPTTVTVSGFTKVLNKFGLEFLNHASQPSISSFVLRVNTGALISRQHNNSVFIVYNGLVVEHILSTPGISSQKDIYFIRDESNSIDFNLQKTEFLNFDEDLIKSANLRIFEAVFCIDVQSCISRIARRLSSYPDWFKYSLSLRVSMELYTSPSAERMYMPTFFINSNRIYPLTDAALITQKIRRFLVCRLDRKYFQSLFEDLRFICPILLLDPGDSYIPSGSISEIEFRSVVDLRPPNGMKALHLSDSDIQVLYDALNVSRLDFVRFKELLEYLERSHVLQFWVVDVAQVRKLTGTRSEVNEFYIERTVSD